MLNEVKAYEKLKFLQGDIIPEFKFNGPNFWDSWATVISYEGKSLNQFSNLNEHIKSKAKECWDKFQRNGIIHGDVALRNFVYNEGKDKVYIIDLEFVKFKEDFGGPDEFQEKLKQENLRFNGLFYDDQDEEDENFSFDADNFETFNNVKSSMDHIKQSKCIEGN